MKTPANTFSGGRKLPILIVDQSGVFGEKLAALTSLETLTLLVSKQERVRQRNVISIPFTSRIPRIPDNTFSHIFVFFQGEEDVLQLIHPLSKKAKETNAKLFFITHRHLASQTFLAKLKDIHSRIHILLFADIFGADEIQTPVQRFIAQAKIDGTLTLYNNGLTLRHPVHSADVFQGILKEADLDHAGKTIALYPPHGTTDLTIARLLAKADPGIQIRLFDKKQAIQNHSPLPAAFAIAKDYPLEKRLVAALRAVAPQRVVKRDPPSSSFASSSGSYGKVLAALLFFLGLFPLLTAVLPGVVGFISLSQSEKAFSAGKINEAKTYASIAKQSFAIAKTGSEVPMSLAPYIGMTDAVGRGVALVEAGSDLSQIMQDGLIAVEFIEKGLQGEGEGSKKDFVRGISLAKNAAVQMQQITLAESMPTVISQKIATLHKPVALFASIADSLPKLFGFEGKRTYLLLFQNNMELRPGGGFIGSYGILRVDNGKVLEFTIHDVYDADGQLTGHIEPPFALRRYVGVNHWFLRDSNFSPVFSKNASLAAKLLHLETGEQVDGVIAVDTKAMLMLLELSGPVYVPDFKEEVSVDNFFLVTQKHVESNFVPGSSQKKDFLRAFYNSIAMKLVEKPPAGSEVVKAIYEAIRQKHIMITVSESKTQQVFMANGLSGAFPSGVADDGSFVDFLALSEANVGANKANYYIKRSLAHRIFVTEQGEYAGSISVRYENTSTPSSPFGGAYENYLRVFVPEQMELVGVSVDGKEEPIVPAVTEHAQYSLVTFTPPDGIEVEKTREEGSVGYGLYIAIAPQESKTIVLSLKATEKIDIDSQIFPYQYTLSKQPGTSSDSFSYILNLPSAFQITDHAGDAAVVSGKQIVASGTFSEDVDFSFTAAKK